MNASTRPTIKDAVVSQSMALDCRRYHAVAIARPGNRLPLWYWRPRERAVQRTFSLAQPAAGCTRKALQVELNLLSQSRIKEAPDVEIAIDRLVALLVAAARGNGFMSGRVLRALPPPSSDGATSS